MAAFGTYAVGSSRVVGGIVVGRGDRWAASRCVALVIMGVATSLIGLPTYESIGPWAAVPIVLRLVRFGVGGEWGGAVLMVSSMPRPARGSAAARIACRPGCSRRSCFALGRLPPDSSWPGLARPFLISIVLVGVGLMIRRIAELRRSRR
jgi:hypothetical protein